MIETIQRSTRFQGKCDSFRSILFPANRTTPDNSPQMIPNPKIVIADHYKPVTPANVQCSLKCILFKSTPGSEGITSSIVAAAHEAIPEQLFDISDALFLHGIHSTSEKIAKFVLIPKPGKNDKDQAKSYWPISLPSCLKKILEKIVDRRTAADAATIIIITEVQGGSRVSRSVQDTPLRPLNPALMYLSKPLTQSTTQPNHTSQ